MPYQKNLFAAYKYAAPAPPKPKPKPAPVIADINPLYPPRCCHETMRLMTGEIGPNDYYFQCDVCGRYQEIR